MTPRARRPVTLYTVAGLPAASASKCSHPHGPETVAGWVAVGYHRTDAGQARDYAAFDVARDPDAFGAAWRAVPSPGSVHAVHVCGCRSDSALPSRHIEGAAEPCASGDGYIDPYQDLDVVCETDGEHYHHDCHGAVCQSRACHAYNMTDES